MRPHPTRPTRPRLARRLALAAAVAVGALASPLIADAALAADGDASWAVRTASTNLGSDRSRFDYQVNPGDGLDDALVVVNHGPQPITLRLYAADGFTTDAGDLDVLTPDKASRGVGAWVVPTQGSVTVAPEESVEVPFRVTVPTGAAPGDYTGAIVTSMADSGADAGVSVDRRLGIRVDLRVAGELAPAMAVEEPRVRFDGSGALDGEATVTYTLHNTGNTTLSAHQAVGVSGPFGWFATDAGDVADPPELLPGERWTVTVPVRDVAAAGRLAATVTVLPVVVDASGSTTTLDPVVARADGWAVPWLALGGVVVLVAGAVVLVLAGRRRRKAGEARRVREAVEQALREREAEAAGTADAGPGRTEAAVGPSIP
jgi:hypothetical protein